MLAKPSKFIVFRVLKLLFLSFLTWLMQSLLTTINVPRVES
jgi:hypothetical protein